MQEVAAVALAQRVQRAGLIEVEEAGEVLHTVTGRGVCLAARLRWGGSGGEWGSALPAPAPQPYLLHIVLLHLQDGSIVVQFHLHFALGQGTARLRPQLAACEGHRALRGAVLAAPRDTAVGSGGLTVPQERQGAVSQQCSPKEKPSLCTSHTFSVSYQASSAAICSSVLACGTVDVERLWSSAPCPTSPPPHIPGAGGSTADWPQGHVLDSQATSTSHKPSQHMSPLCLLGIPVGTELQRPPGPCHSLGQT